MTTAMPRAVEQLLARLYTDDALRHEFLASPEAVARRAGLDEGATRQLAAIDRDGLVLAASSYAHKRQAHAAHRAGRPWLAWWRAWRRR